MMWKILFCVIVLLLLSTALGGKGFGPGKQDFGYVSVRDKAHMFWWLFHTTAPVNNSAERPLILWLTGGPGSPSTGIGNFGAVGPLDLHLEPRNTTWIKDFNLLFVDCPVGTGYSYVENETLLNYDNEMVARDLIVLLEGFYDELPQFKISPLYVYGSSYGGIFAVHFVNLLVDEVKTGHIKANISGLVLADVPIQMVYVLSSWGTMLYELGLVDLEGQRAIIKQANEVKHAVDEGRFYDATDEAIKTQITVQSVTGGIEFLNILKKVTKETSVPRNVPFISDMYPKEYLDLQRLMNGSVKKALGIPKHVQWRIKNDEVFNKLWKEIMRPTTNIVERLLNETDIKIYIANGNLDLLVSTPGQLMWIDELRWPLRQEYLNASRNTIWVNDTMQGYEKTGGKLSFFWINDAGHHMPADNPVGARAMLKNITGI